MIEYLEQSKVNPQTFTTTNKRRSATHFRRDGGPIRPIGELLDKMDRLEDVQNSRVVLNVPSEPSDGLPDPLPLPTMNFGDADEQPVIGDVLPLPVMNFDPPGKKHEKKVQTANNTGLPEPLPLPSL